MSLCYTQKKIGQGSHPESCARRAGDAHGEIASRIDAILAKYADYVVVPREPTQEIIDVMADCYDPTWGYSDDSVGSNWARVSYRAMLSAAGDKNE